MHTWLRSGVEEGFVLLFIRVSLRHYVAIGVDFDPCHGFLVAEAQKLVRAACRHSPGLTRFIEFSPYFGQIIYDSAHIAAELGLFGAD